MHPIFGVIADDLTGGMETASMLVALGVDVQFVTNPEIAGEVGSAPVVVVAQKTRVIPAPDAVRKSDDAARALLALGARQLFFKYCATFDSTDEGNIGPVADRLLELTGQPVTMFCPAAPEVGRTVYNGHLFVGTQLVSDSPKRFDPLTPMTDPDLVRVLQRQSTLPVGLLPHHLVRTGKERLSRHVEKERARGLHHFIADAIYEEDLTAIAELTVDWKVVTGNSPVVQHYPPIWRRRGLLDEKPSSQRLPAVGGHAVVLAGSCAERTFEQLAAFEASRPVFRIDLTSVASGNEAIGSALEWARARIEAGPIAIATSATPEKVREAQDRLGRDGAAGLAEAILGALAVELRELGARRFVVAGGETSGTVVERLGIDRLRIGRYAGPGVSRATSEVGEPIGLCLKSGKLGPVDMFLQVLEQMTVEEVQ
ncbi:3-oxo-tetronate kinase [Aquamicrobium sp. LC103]|uniref:3-oxo-tetronate kinase n=1 Tax=Aquamicrobium sp. LC103 TaxID=1120658 RepID=UPI00063E6F72|nr:3-oxo-tetronate kinase [Aquamicrobium sp. LC103]TKT69293.1 four-carbon acid sugar kinase family protein [Aquamicrobium sp. LC103]